MAASEVFNPRTANSRCTIVSSVRSGSAGGQVHQPNRMRLQR
jgi:hypothetical protein